MLAAAAHDPRTLALGIDAVAASMAESSRRAAGPLRKGGLRNAAFIVAAAEAMPPELRGIAGFVTVNLPWGSLLRGCLGTDPAVAGGIAGLVAPGGRLELLLAPAERDGLSGLPIEPTDVVDAASRTFGAAGFHLVEGRAATADELRASGSTWAKRLRRPAALVRLELGVHR